MLSRRVEYGFFFYSDFRKHRKKNISKRAQQNLMEGGRHNESDGPIQMCVHYGRFEIDARSFMRMTNELFDVDVRLAHFILFTSNWVHTLGVSDFYYQNKLKK